MFGPAAPQGVPTPSPSRSPGWVGESCWVMLLGVSPPCWPCPQLRAISNENSNTSLPNEKCCSHDKPQDLCDCRVTSSKTCPSSWQKNLVCKVPSNQNQFEVL